MEEEAKGLSFVRYIAESLASHPEDIQIDRKVDEKGVLFTLTCHKEDTGRLVGKEGSTAQSMRTLLRVLGAKDGARYSLKIDMR